VISYCDSTNGDLKVAGCTNVTCTSAVISTVDSTGNVGVYTSSTLDSLGLVQISYYDLTNGNLKIAFCDDDRCTSAGFVTADSTGNVGAFTSIATGKDGLPIVSYIDRTNLNLKTMHCNNDICSSRTIRTIDTGIATASDDSYTSIAIGADGLPMIAYFNAAASDLKTAHCADVKCSNSVVRTLDSAGLVGRYTSLAIGIDGLPFISYEDETNGDLDTVDCGSPGCVSYGRKR